MSNFASPGAINLAALGVSSTAAQIDAAVGGLPAGITASRAVVSDGSGVPTAATTTAAEIGYVNGVTSAIQTQLNGKKKTWVAAPATADATGVAGDMAYADGILYVCVATNTWQKCTIATWS